MLRIATIGTSPITSDCIEVINASHSATFVGTLSRDPKRGQAFTQERGGTRTFTSLDELASSGEVDAVYIGSPNALHARQALACIAGGKHVIAEKPLGANEREARAVFDAAEKAGVVVLEAMRPLHDPAFVAVRDLMRNLGRIRRADLHFGKYSSRYDEILAGKHTNIFDCAMATGSLMDIGVYTVEPLIELFGAPESVLAAPVLLDEETRGLTHGPLDGSGVIIARYADFVATLHFSKITNDRLPSQIESETATLTFDGISVPTWARVEHRGTAVRAAAKQVHVEEGARTEEFKLPQVGSSRLRPARRARRPLRERSALSRRHAGISRPHGRGAPPDGRVLPRRRAGKRCARSRRTIAREGSARCVSSTASAPMQGKAGATRSAQAVLQAAPPQAAC